MNVKTETYNLSASSLKNIGFKFIYELFNSYGWHLIKNELNQISFSKPGYETDVFDICIDKYRISVGIPVKNSPYLYRTYFQDYYHASEYIEERFNEFIQVMKC
jgi:hypothetical protein